MSPTTTEIIASWKGETTFIGTNDSGGTVQMGSFEGKVGVGPMQLLLVSLAGCTGVDIVTILQKKRINLSDIKVKVQAKRANDFPMVWTDIHVTYLLWGENLEKNDIEQAIHLSEEKYCSVGIMLGKSANITSEFKLFGPGEIATL